MRVGKLLIMGGTAFALTLTACGSGSPSPSAGSAAAATTSTVPGTSTSARPALCVALERLGRSIRAADDTDSMAEFRAQVEAAREDYEAVQKAAAGEFSVQAGELDQAMADVQEGSKASRAETATKLARGYERLNAATACP
jgi:hypothetical protein